MKTIAISQSNYIPWKGYFDLINSVDEFVIYDQVQFTRRDWRNRNRIKTRDGLLWLTIPVRTKGRFLQRIDETRIADPGWAARHWATLANAYARAPFFAAYEALVSGLYGGCREELLSRVNRRFIAGLCAALGIRTPIRGSDEFVLEGNPSERLAGICAQAGAGAYATGPRARDYLEEGPFARAGVSLVWMDYEGYRPYPQLHGGYEDRVSVLDLLFNTGPDAAAYMKSFGAPAEAPGGGP